MHPYYLEPRDLRNSVQHMVNERISNNKNKIHIHSMGRETESGRDLTKRWITDVTMIVSGGVHDEEIG